MKRLIPNMITCCNLLSGMVAVYMATQHFYLLTLICIIAGAIFDFFDGMTARALHVSSPIGKELDSLADIVTFGVAPSMTLVCYLQPILGWWSCFGMLMAAFSALRLAKFNLDDRQVSAFLGLPTPSNAIFWVSLICSFPEQMQSASPWFGIILLAISFFSCYILVCSIPFFALKFHNFKWKENRYRFLFLFGGIILLIFAICTKQYRILGAAVILWYILMNFLLDIFQGKQAKIEAND